MDKPVNKPQNPCFSSGPCAKRPGWNSDILSSALTGRSHRSAPCKVRLQDVIEKHRRLLGIPADYRIAIVPASDTGAIEMALWSMLGPRPVDVFAWESFSKAWLGDITKELKIEGARGFTAPYGSIPDLSQADPAHDTVFVWNGTTSGVRVQNGDWISDTREGLTFCDATSAVFAYDMPWEKLDVTTWSWQKVMGGEAAHGMLVLSPRAVERLESYVPDRPLPKIFRMVKNGKINEGLFKGATLNTPSMLAVEDCLDALNWIEGLGGLEATKTRVDNNFKAVESWVGKTDWIDFLAGDAATRSKTAICLNVIDPWLAAMNEDSQWTTIRAMAKKLDDDNVAFDIVTHRDAPPGLRIWAGATIETSDIETLLPWLDWAYTITKAEQQEQAA